MSKGWIGVDLDGTLAEYHGWQGVGQIGGPIPIMVERVKQWLSEGKDVRIFTARLSTPGHEREAIARPIDAWCERHLGKRLPVTNVKDLDMAELWDDRCVEVVPNSGARVCSIEERFRGARPRVVELAFEALELHAKKNNDYTGNGPEYLSMGLHGRLCDVLRKVNRLHTFVVKGVRNMVPETLKDTAIDLAVYALLLAEDLERKPEGDSVVTECLVCGGQTRVSKDAFRGHHWCPGCEDTTNQIEVKAE